MNKKEIIEYLASKGIHDLKNYGTIEKALEMVDKRLTKEELIESGFSRNSLLCPEKMSNFKVSPRPDLYEDIDNIPPENYSQYEMSEYCDGCEESELGLKNCYFCNIPLRANLDLPVFESKTFCDSYFHCDDCMRHAIIYNCL